MAVPGFSVSELIVALKTATNVYDAFFDDFQNAPARIQELAETSKYLHDILENFLTLFAHYGGVFPAETTYRRRLAECDAFINKYSELKPVDPTNERCKLPQRYRRVWQTTKFAFDDAQSLEHRLSLEIQKLVPYILLFALKHAEPGNHVPVCLQASNPSSNGTIPSLPSRDDDRFQNILRNLQKIRYSFEREMSLAAVNRSVPDCSNIYSDLNQEWQKLCSIAGLSGQRIPRLCTERLLQSPSQQWNDMVVNMARADIYPPLLEPTLPSVMTSTESNISEEDTNSSSLSPEDSGSFKTTATTPLTVELPTTETHAPPLNLGRTRTLPCKATIILREPHRLYLWHFDQLPSGRRLAWERGSHSSILEHDLPSEVFPYTKKSSFKEPLLISFNDNQRLRLVTQGSIEDEYIVKVNYQFVTEEDYKKFQEDLRNKDLLETYDFAKISSNRKAAHSYGEATGQDLKLWRSRDQPQIYTISFFSNCVSHRHLEFPVHWFDSLVDSNKSIKTVRLNFIRREKTIQKPKESNRRKSNIFMRWPSFSGSSPYSIRPVSGASPAPPSNARRSSNRTSITSSESSNETDYEQLLPLSEIAESYQFLTIKFIAISDMKSFLVIFNDVRKTSESLTLFMSQSHSASPGSNSPT